MPPQALAAVATLLAVRAAWQPHRAAAGPRQRRAGVGRAEHVPLPARAGRAAAPNVGWTATNRWPSRREDTPAAVRAALAARSRSRSRSSGAAGQRAPAGWHAADARPLRAAVRGGGRHVGAAMPGGRAILRPGPAHRCRASTCAASSVRAEVPFLVTTGGLRRVSSRARALIVSISPAATATAFRAPEIDYYFYLRPHRRRRSSKSTTCRGRSPSRGLVAQRALRQSWADAARRRCCASCTARCRPRPLRCSTWRPTTRAPEELQARARQLGSLVARVIAGDGRARAASASSSTRFSAAMSRSCRTAAFRSGIRCPSRFPTTAEGARHADEFLLGDEMLVAPILRARRQAQRLSAARQLDESGDQ